MSVDQSLSVTLISTHTHKKKYTMRDPSVHKTWTFLETSRLKSGSGNMLQIIIQLFKKAFLQFVAKPVHDSAASHMICQSLIHNRAPSYCPTLSTAHFHIISAWQATSRWFFHCLQTLSLNRVNVLLALTDNNPRDGHSGKK